jgi:integrase
MKKTDLFLFFDEEIVRLTRVKSASTVRNYHTAMNALAGYLGRRSLQLDDVSRQLMQDFEQWLHRRGVCRNTSSAYMRSLQSLFNRAVDAGLTSERNPFRRVFTGNERTEKRAISRSQLSRLLSAPVPLHSRLLLYADVLRFSFVVCGMPFVDIAHLRWRQIEGNTLVYRRQKTGERVRVYIEVPARDILRRYWSDSPDDYVFPLMHSEADYPLALARYNRALRRLSYLSGLTCRITSYVMRHTWASLQNQSHTPPAVISRGLGHTNIRTTATYISSLSDNLLHIYNGRLLKSLFSKLMPAKLQSSYKEDCTIR